jgi:polysaccharide export outer membrane protein
VIEITVLGLPQLDKVVTILPDGTIAYPRLGTIKVAGMTLQELQAYLASERTGLNRFYNHPDITVTLRTLRTDHVSVRGAVRTPGIYDLRRGWSIRELLAAAGDLASVNGPPAPGQMRATLIRRNGERVLLNLPQLLSAEGTAALPPLEPDDVLLVEDLTIQVTVDGQVVQPGTVSLPPGATVLDALRAAKGQTEKAALTKAYVRRGLETIPVNLLPLVNGSTTALPFVLQRSDILSVPENKNKILILGGVVRPGAILLPEDEVLQIPDALGRAGGPVPRARLKDVSLVRQHDGKLTPTTVNVEEMLTKGRFNSDFTLRPGDTIYVPDPKDRGNFNPASILPFLTLLF